MSQFNIPRKSRLYNQSKTVKIKVIGPKLAFYFMRITRNISLTVFSVTYTRNTFAPRPTWCCGSGLRPNAVQVVVGGLVSQSSHLRVHNIIITIQRSGFRFFFPRELFTFSLSRGGDEDNDDEWWQWRQMRSPQK